MEVFSKKETYLNYDRNIKYLLKFVREEYLEYLLTKGLYMNQVNYFVSPHRDDDGQYDCWESLCSSELSLYKNRNRPIWCCTAISISDISEGIVKLDKRLLTDFFKNKIQEGKIVLIDFKQFVERLYTSPDEYEMNFGRINYYSHPKQIGERFPSNDWSDSIFLKSRKYSYQKEFRVAINRACGVQTEKRKIFRFFHDFDVITSYEPYEYYLPDIKSISKIFSATELEIGKDFFNLKIC